MKMRNSQGTLKLNHPKAASTKHNPLPNKNNVKYRFQISSKQTPPPPNSCRK